MRKFLSGLYSKTLGLVSWLEVASHRRRLYQVLAVLGGALTAAGLLTPDQVAHWLGIAGSVLLLGGGSVAARHTAKAAK